MYVRWYGLQSVCPMVPSAYVRWYGLQSIRPMVPPAYVRAIDKSVHPPPED
jgi:hypothetical protein